MAYLIDGNNFLGYASKTGLYHSGRNQLVQGLLKLIRIRHARVRLVFDGPPDPGLAEFDDFHGKPLSISYPPPGSTADDVIQLILDKHTDRRTLTVVSSDKEVLDYARSKGAKMQTCPQFQRTFRAAIRDFNKLRAEEKEAVTLSPLELNQWMDVFESREKKDDG